MTRPPFHLEPLPPAPPDQAGGGRGHGTLWPHILWRGIVYGLLSVAACALLAVLGALGTYTYYASQLPSPSELYERAAAFESAMILDRHGRPLYEVFDPMGGRRTTVSFDEVPNVLVQAVVATEDATFFNNPGFSIRALVRAVYLNLTEGEIVSGASTITQQLVKNLYLTREQTYSRKIKEAILAAEITRRYEKSEILGIYLNEIYFGNLSYGVGAAADTYFGVQVSQIDLPEAALLAGMIRSGVLYDPYAYPERALARRNTVLELMWQRGYITRREMEAAQNAPLDLEPQTIEIQAPHMVMAVRQLVEREYGTEMLYKGGLRVYTTLDLDMQRLAEEIVAAKVAELHPRNANNASLVAMRADTGEVLALVGSADFWDHEIGGQVNVAMRLQQPGSTIKPFVYLAAMERGWSPATMLMDVETEFPDGANPPYVPHNYDEETWGPISMRSALACSRNIPAVSTLHQIGLPALLDVCHRLGIASLDRPDYGLSLALGAGDATLLEMTGAYAALASGGYDITPRLIHHIEYQDGETLLAAAEGSPELVMDPRHAYLLTDMLADQAAREPAFGRNNVLQLSFPAAAKTGTTNDYRDSWTIGYTPSLVTGVWVGNSDNTPMDKVSGTQGAGIIWHDFMERALAGTPQQAFVRPEGLVKVKVCPISGMIHGESCPAARTEWFLPEDAPREPCHVHRRVKVCRASGALASEHCPAELVDEIEVVDLGGQWDAWVEEQGDTPPPRATCAVHTHAARVHLVVASPLLGIASVRGSADAPDFGRYVVQYASAARPDDWHDISPHIRAPRFEGELCQWDTTRVPNGSYLLRLQVFDRHGHAYVAETIVEVRNATVTPTWTAIPTWTAAPSLTPTITRTPTARSTPTVTATRRPPLVPSPWPTTVLWPTRPVEPAPTRTRAVVPPPPTATLTATPGLVPRVVD